MAQYWDPVQGQYVDSTTGRPVSQNGVSYSGNGWGAGGQQAPASQPPSAGGGWGSGGGSAPSAGGWSDTGHTSTPTTQQPGGATGYTDNTPGGGNGGQWNATNDPSKTNVGGTTLAPIVKGSAVDQKPTNDPLTQPGTAEDWYKQNAWRWTQPTQQQQEFQGLKGDFTNHYTPTNTQAQYDTLTGELAGPQRGTQAAYGASQYFGQGPGGGEDYAGQAIGSGYFSTPGAMETYAQGALPQLSGPQAGEQAARGFQQGLSGPGAAETNYGAATQALGGINYGAQGISAANRGAAQGQNAGSYFGSQLMPFSQGNTVGAESSYFMPGLEQKSYSENLMDTGANGHLLDPYMRAQDVQQRKLDDAAAAKGMFNSGASLRNDEELAKDTEAQSAQAQIALAQQADQAHLARAAGAQGFSAAAGSEALGRQGLGLTGAEASDTSARNAALLQLQGYGAASQEGLQKVTEGTQAGTAAEQAQIQRMFQGGQLGLSADQDTQNRIQTGGQLASSAQAAGNQRYTAGFDIAKGGQDLATQRNQNAADYGLKGDASDLARIQTLFGAGQTMDAAQLQALQQQLAQDQQGFGMAGTVDAQSRQQLLDAQASAQAAQENYQGRQAQDWGQGFQTANAQAGLTAGATGHATDEQTQLGLSQIQTMISQGQLTQQQGEAMAQQIYGVGLTALKAYGAKT